MNGDVVNQGVCAAIAICCVLLSIPMSVDASPSQATGGTNGTLTLPNPPDPKPIPITSLAVNATGSGSGAQGYLQVTTGTGEGQTTLYLSLTSNQVSEFYQMMYPFTVHQAPRATGAPPAHNWTPFVGGLLVSSGMPSYRGSVAIPPSATLRIQRAASHGAAASLIQYVIPVASMSQIVNAFGAVVGVGK